MTMRCAFLRMGDTGDWVIDSDLAFAPLAQLGWRCEWLPWRQSDRLDNDWNDWDAVYVAATWDYPDAPTEFLQTLEAIEASRAVLVNDLGLIRWNLSKTYLRDLENRGIAIVPSRWYRRFPDWRIDADFGHFRTERLIAKPVVGANAADTFLLEREIDADTLVRLERAFAARAFVVQPFIDTIRTSGEYSLMYVGGEHSHAIQKIPKSGDFRVQEEHGADIRSVCPEPALRDAADRLMETVVPAPLYARCDFVRDNVGTYRVMELELIEPSLYLRTNESAASRFAAAFDTYMKSRIRRQL